MKNRRRSGRNHGTAAASAPQPTPRIGDHGVTAELSVEGCACSYRENHGEKRKDKNDFSKTIHFKKLIPDDTEYALLDKPMVRQSRRICLIVKFFTSLF